MKNYYYILGVESNSTENEIKAAYRKLSLKLHPDTNNGEKFFEDRFKDIFEAYNVLSNKKERRAYDRQLRAHDRKEEAISIKKQELAEQFEEMYREKEEELIKNYQSLEETLQKKLGQINKLSDFLKKRKLQFATVFLILISSLFIQGTVPGSILTKSATEIEKETIRDKAEVTKLIYEWNQAHNEKNLLAFSELFADSLIYYGKPKNNKRCIDDKFLFFQKNPDLNREISDQIRIEKINEITYKGFFLKKVKSVFDTKYFPSYLVFKKGKKGWKIIVEGDLVTDSNNTDLNKRFLGLPPAGFGVLACLR